MASFSTIRVVALCLVSEKSLEDGAYRASSCFFGGIADKVLDIADKVLDIADKVLDIVDKVLVVFILCRDENNPMVA